MAESVVETPRGFFATVTLTIGKVQFQKEDYASKKDDALAKARGQLADDPYYQFLSQRRQQ